jgi:hypothetical protein
MEHLLGREVRTLLAGPPAAYEGRAGFTLEPFPRRGERPKGDNVVEIGRRTSPELSTHNYLSVMAVAV